MAKPSPELLRQLRVVCRLHRPDDLKLILVHGPRCPSCPDSAGSRVKRREVGTKRWLTGSLNERRKFRDSCLDLASLVVVIPALAIGQKPSVLSQVIQGAAERVRIAGLGSRLLPQEVRKYLRLAMIPVCDVLRKQGTVQPLERRVNRRRADVTRLRQQTSVLQSPPHTPLTLAAPERLTASLPRLRAGDRPWFIPAARQVTFDACRKDPGPAIKYANRLAIL